MRKRDFKSHDKTTPKSEDSWRRDSSDQDSESQLSTPPKIGVKRLRHELNEDFLAFEEDDAKFNLQKQPARSEQPNTANFPWLS